MKVQPAVNIRRLQNEPQNELTRQAGEAYYRRKPN